MTFHRFCYSLLLAVSVLVVAPQAPSAQTKDEDIWKNFLMWLQTAPPVDSPRILFARYKARLAEAGGAPAEVDAELATVQRLHRIRPDAWRVMFNNIYSSTTPGYSIQPNQLLMATAEARTPGTALDIGMGQGRNSVYLALKGWTVTGFDMSDQGIAIAKLNAERAGVKLDAVLSADDSFDYGLDRWDLIAFIYEPFPITTPAYVARLGRALKAGGVLVVESFGEEESVAGRPATAVDPGKLREAFKDFRIVKFDVVQDVPDWRAPNDLSLRRLVRMVAEKL